MHLLGLNSMDIIILGIVLLLSLKGLVSGPLKETLQTISIIGAIVVASYLSPLLSQKIKPYLLSHSSLNPALIKLLSFIVILAAVWFILKFISDRIDKEDFPLLRVSQRVAGMIVSFLKYFLIFSIIVAVLSQSKLFKDKFSKELKGSQIAPVMIKTGSILLNLPNSSESIKIK